MSRAFTVASLAAEWECSEGVIRKAVRGEFIITDPRIYYGEMQVDDQAAYLSRDQSAWQMHVARDLVRTATADWLRELEELTFIGLRTAIAAGSRRAKTPKAVECEASQSGGVAVSPR